MLNDLLVLSYIALFYILSFPFGYLLLRISIPNKRSGLPFLVMIPIILSLGLMTLTLTVFIAGFLVISGYVITIIFLVSILLNLSISFYKRKTRKIVTSNGTRKPSTFLTKNLILIVLFAVTFLNFGVIVSYTGWPPVGDAITHGLLVSLLLMNGRIRLDYLPLSSYSMDNPLGFHVLAANFSSLTGVLPGQAVYLLAASILILLPALLYSLMYIISNSAALASLAFLSAFTVPPLNMEYYLTGYFYNGPYPNLFGFLGIILICSLEALRERTQKEQTSTDMYVVVFSIAVLSIFAIYTTFALFPILYVLLRYPKKLLTRAYQFTKNRWKPLVLVTLIFTLAILLNEGFIIDAISIALIKLQKVYARSFDVDPAFFLSSVGIIVIIATLISVFNLFKRTHTSLSLFFMIVIIPCLISLSDSVISSYLAILLPRRSLLIDTLLSWITIFAFTSYLFSRMTNFKLRFRNSTWKINSGAATTIVVSAILVGLIVAPPLITNLTFGSPPRGWFLVAVGSDNYNVLQWISTNISPHDLILNDYSYSSQFLLSFSIKNLTCDHYLDNATYDRALDSHEFWKQPDNYSLFAELMDKYGIKYVLVTSESGYQDWSGVGGTNQYLQKPFGAHTREVFDGNPFVQLVYESDLAAVYKVNRLNVSFMSRL